MFAVFDSEILLHLFFVLSLQSCRN